MTFTDRDLRDQILTATHASDGTYDVDAILAEIIEKHGAVDVEGIDTGEFWTIVGKHYTDETTTSRVAGELLTPIITLAALVADDLDRLGAAPVAWVRADFSMENGRHGGLTRQAQAWAEEWGRFPADLGAAPAAAAFLRSLPALAARAETLGGDDRWELEPSDEITTLLRETFFVDADVIAYRQFADAEDVRQGKHPRAAANLVSWAWEHFLTGYAEALRADLDEARALLAARGAE